MTKPMMYDHNEFISTDAVAVDADQKSLRRQSPKRGSIECRYTRTLKASLGGDVHVYATSEVKAPVPIPGSSDFMDRARRLWNSIPDVDLIEHYEAISNAFSAISPAQRTRMKSMVSGLVERW